MPKSAGTGRHGLPGLRKRRGQGGENAPASENDLDDQRGLEPGHGPARPESLSFFDGLGSHGSFSEAGQDGFAAPGGPGSTVPGTTVPGSIMPGSPGSTVPGDTVPGSTVPGSIMADRAMPDRAMPDGASLVDGAGDPARETRRRGWSAGRAAALTGALAVLAAGGVTLAYAGLPGSSASGGTAPGQGGNTVLPLGSRSISQAGSRPQFADGSASPGTGGTAGPLRTSCQAVAHIGDSTSDGLISPEYLPKKWQRIPARYKHVGARSVWTNIEGARSIVEVIPGTTNGYDAARQMTRQGFRGCWVLALGTDDTADVAAGSLTSLSTRIHRMMAAASGQPVMWVNVKTLLSSGPYAEANMQRWNSALLKACARYPNMRIYDWSAAARNRWFISDGIHYTSAGYAARARLIANAVARAFPARGRSSGCVVR